MKMICDVPDEAYKAVKCGTWCGSYVAEKMIANGTPIPDNIGDFSDGYHTFNQLYHQRAVLFATIVNLNQNISWKSWKHEDGKYCFDSNGEWFIVGIDTPQGSYTYHYEKAYWDMFKCQELSNGKHWDGHTEDDVIRLLSLVPLVSIPDNATNGDMLIRLYPNLKYTIQNGRVVTTIGVASSFDLDWWNTPYQKGGTSENNI